MNLSSSKKALLAGISGTTLQWYDFALFGYFAPIIGDLYFPSDNRMLSILSTFGVFAVGYLLAPLGALLFGYIGDKFGRKKALTLSILAMAIPTALMSLVPSYQSIGIIAPILIVFLRIMQGFVAESEYTGSAIFLVEHAKPNEKAFYGCLTSSAYSLGTLLAGLSASFFTASFMPDWAWRISFALALIAGLLIFYFRIHVKETPEFEQIMPQHQQGQPFIKALKNTPYAILGVMGITWLIGVLTYGTYVFSSSYMHHYFHVPLSQASLIITLSLLVDAALEPFIALYADRVGLLKVIQYGMVLTILASVPLFQLIVSGNLLFITLGMMGLSVLVAITCAPLNAYMVSLFPREYRYSAFGTAFNTGISLFGGTAPLILMWLIDSTGSLISPAYYYMLAAVIGLASLVLCEYSRRRVNHAHSMLVY